MQMRNNKFTRSNSLIGTWEKKGRHKTKLHLHIEGIRSQGLIVYYGSVLKKIHIFSGNTEMNNAQTSKEIIYILLYT